MSQETEAGDEGNRYNATGTLDPTGNYTAEGTLRLV